MSEAATWDDVAENPEFQRLSTHEKRAARKEYFYDVVAPQLQSNELEPAWNEFLQDTEPGIAGVDPSQPTGEYLKNRLKTGVAGGGAFMLGGAGDIAMTPGMLLGALGVPGLHDPTKDEGGWTPTTTAARGALEDTLGVKKGLLPPSQNTKIAGGIVEAAGATPIPSAAVIKQAPNKVAAALAELWSTVGGGIGGEVAGAPGALVGGAGGATIAPSVTKVASAITPRITGALADRSPQKMAGNELVTSLEAHPASVTNMQHAKVIEAQLKALGIKDFKPTLGQRSGAEGIVSREHQIASSSPADLGRYSERVHSNALSVEEAIGKAFPPTERTVQQVAELGRGPTVAKLEAELSRLNDERAALSQRFDVTGQKDTGERLVALRDQAQEVARGVKNSKIQGVYDLANQLGVKEDMSDVVSFVKQLRDADPNTFQDMPPVFGKVLRELSSESAAPTGRSIDPELVAYMAQRDATKAQVSFETLHSLWRETNSQLGAAMRAGDSAKQHYLMQLREQLTNKLSKYEGEEFGGLAERFRDFNKFYATQYAPAFKEGVGGRMVATGKYGDVTKPETIVSKFFTPSGIDDFTLIYGTSKEAQQALADGVLGMVRKSSVKNGEVDQKALDSFMRKNAEVLDRLPDIKAVLSDTGRRNTALMEASERGRQALREYDKSFIARLARTPAPEKMLDAALAGDDAALQTLINAGRDSQSKATIARALADRIPHAAQQAGIDPLAFVLKNEKSLRGVLDRLGKGHFDNLKTIAGAQTIIGRVTPPTTVGAGKVPDPLEGAIGTSTSSLMNMLRTVFVTRAAGVHGMATVLSGKFWNMKRQKAADALMREAIYDPQIADDLAKAVKAGNNVPVPLANSIMDHLSTLGFRIGATEGEQS